MARYQLYAFVMFVSCLVGNRAQSTNCPGFNICQSTVTKKIAENMKNMPELCRALAEFVPCAEKAADECGVLTMAVVQNAFKFVRTQYKLACGGELPVPSSSTQVPSTSTTRNSSVESSTSVASNTTRIQATVSLTTRTRQEETSTSVASGTGNQSGGDKPIEGSASRPVFHIMAVISFCFFFLL